MNNGIYWRNAPEWAVAFGHTKDGLPLWIGEHCYAYCRTPNTKYEYGVTGQYREHLVEVITRQEAQEVYKAGQKREEAMKQENPYVKKFTKRMQENQNFDVYDVCNAFELDPIRAHAVKKILVTGLRNGGKTPVQDIKEAIWSLNELLKEWENKTFIRRG
jgi:hypothetical protein